MNEKDEIEFILKRIRNLRDKSSFFDGDNEKSYIFNLERAVDLLIENKLIVDRDAEYKKIKKFLN
tara:strand:- start:91 stop:285 length:195 start_codon:yes stop_codon:yes gene_type:complete